MIVCLLIVEEAVVFVLIQLGVLVNNDVQSITKHRASVDRLKNPAVVEY